jgi:acetyl esterase
MNKLQKAAFKALSLPYINIKKNYRLQRKMLRIVNPYLRPAYNMLDKKIMAGDREIPVRVFPAAKDSSGSTILFFHGGGWVAGDIDSYTKVCAYMAKQTGSTVISVDYRLAPENPFPAGVEDCYCVARELFRHPDLAHCSRNDITIAGYSAGANLAAVTALLARDRGEFMPCRQILICPATYNDHSAGSPFPSVQENGTDYILTSQKVSDYMDLYIQNEKFRSSPYAAPLLAEDLSRQPRTLVITAEYDPLRDEGEAYGRKLKESGNTAFVFRIRDALHGFFALPLATDALAETYQIIDHFMQETDDVCEVCL